MKPFLSMNTLRNIIIAITLTIALTTIFLMSGCSKSAEDNFNIALEYYQDRSFREAIPYFEDAITIEPENMKARFFLGVSHKAIGNLDKALVYIKDSNEVNPDDFYILYHLADTYLKMGNFNEAVRYTRKSLKVKPDFMDSHFLLATALNRAEKTTEAINELEFLRILMKEENPAMYNQVLFQLSDLYRREGKLEDSLASSQELIARQPDTPEYIYSLALTYLLMGNKPEAQKQLSKLEELNNPLADTLRSQFSK